MKELQKIRQMVGQSYMYKKEVYKITGFIPEEQKVRITTDKQDIVLLEDGLHHALTMFHEADDEQSATLQVQQQTQLQGNLNDLKQILMETLHKVREDKGFVQQAVVVNKTITNYGGLLKLELEAYKLSQKQ
jgi:hypothetical protein